MVQHIRSGSPYEERWGFTRAVVVGDRVIVSGTAPIAPPGDEMAESAYDQMMRCGDIVRAALTEAGVTMGDVIRTRMFITDEANADEIGRAHRELFGEAMPAATMIKTELIDPSWLIELEVEASFPRV